MDMAKYRGLFLSETTEHLRRMNQLIIAIEQDPADREGIDALFREAHSIKGMAASMGFEHTAELSHHLEDLMDGFRKSGTVPPEAVDRLLAGIDLLEGLLDDIKGENPERDIAEFISGSNEPLPESQVSVKAADPADAGEAAPDEEAVPVSTFNVLIDLDEDAPAPAARSLLILETLAQNGVVESSKPSRDEVQQGFVARNLSIWLQTARSEEEISALLGSMPDVNKVSFAADRRQSERPQRRDEDHRTVRVRTALLDRFINLTGELITNRYMLQSAATAEDLGDVRDGLNQLTRLVADLHHHVLQVRMMPLESITATLPRIVRDHCRKTDKQVRLQIEGDNVELDRSILEELSDPLVHMVRNAVDHGIEKEGEIAIRAWREKDLVLIQVADNGRGIDPQALRNKIREKNLLKSSQIKALGDRELFQWICHPGLSTRDEVTETSGRGVGMDVVKAAVEHLGGLLEIDSTPGQGTRFLMKLPLSVAIIKILLVECSRKLLGIPVTRVLRTLDVPRGDIQLSGRQQIITLDDEVIPLYSLNEKLDLPGNGDVATAHIVVSEIQGRKVGLLVDRLSGQREAFIKTLDFPLNQIAGLSGATVLGDGSVVFVLDPQALFESEPEMPEEMVAEEAL